MILSIAERMTHLRDNRHKTSQADKIRQILTRKHLLLVVDTGQKSKSIPNSYNIYPLTQWQPITRIKTLIKNNIYYIISVLWFFLHFTSILPAAASPIRQKLAFHQWKLIHLRMKLLLIFTIFNDLRQWVGYF